MKESPQVVVIGAASMDTKGRAAKRLVPATSNPGRIRVSAGGVGRNVAENLARLGVSTLLFSAVGDDEAGKHILEVTAPEESMSAGSWSPPNASQRPTWPSSTKREP